MTALDREKHRGLRFAPAKGFAFAAEEMACPVVVGEAALVARDIPIVFSKADHMPLAVLGLKPGHNAYVDMKGRAKGKWLGRYVPAHFRRYPFMLARQEKAPEKDGKQLFTVMADLAAPHFAASKGTPLFDEQGQPTEVLQQAQKTLMNLQQQFVRTQYCAKQIADAGLLVERGLAAKTAEGKALALEGLMMVDTKKLAELPGEKLAELRKSGALTLVYAHLMSLSNLNEAPLRTVEDLAPQQPSELAGDTLSLSGLG